MAQKRIKFGIDFEVNQSGLKNLYSSLYKLSNIKLVDFDGSKQEFNKFKDDLSKIQAALKTSFNTRLNTYDIKRFREELNKSNISLKEMPQLFNKARYDGKSAFLSLERGLHGMKMQAKETNSFIQEISKTMLNAAKWSVAYGIVNKIADGIRNAYSFTKDLDESLNSIRIVTGKSAEEMDIFANKANKAAAALGKTTKDYTQAALIFYQQGLKQDQVDARTNVTLKAANVTGQSTQEVSQQLTAIWNGYKVSAEEAELYIDKVSAVAATTASNLQELSEGMSKVASAANTMGVDIDELNAQLSTIIAVTRQDAATAGTALKTIYARMTDIESGLDTETTLGEYTAKMAQFGIQVLDSKGALRDVGDVMQEIGDKWGDFTKTQQVALAQAMAGTRQYNNLMALFGNWDMYTKSLQTSKEAMGTLQQQQDTYMDSLKGHLQQLTAAKENVYNSLFDSKSFKDLIDSLTTIVNEFASFTDAVGGFKGVLFMIAPLLLTIFGPSLSNNIANSITNMQIAAQQTQSFKTQLSSVNETLQNGTYKADEFSESIAKMRQQAFSAASMKLISPEEFNIMQDSIDQVETKTQELYEYEAAVEKAKQATQDFGIAWDVEKTEGKDLEYTTKVLNKLEEKLQQIEDYQKNTEKNGNTFADNVLGVGNLPGMTTGTTFSELGVSGEEIQKILQLKQSYEDLIIKIKEKEQALNDASASGKASVEEITEISRSLSSLRGWATKTKNALQEEVEVAFENTQKKIQTTSNVISKATTSFKEDTKNGMIEPLKNLEQMGKKIDLGKAINQFTSLASKGLMLISVFNNLANIKNIISNKELSNGEKFKQVLTTLLSTAVMAGPLLVGTITKIKAFSAAVTQNRLEILKTVVAQKLKNKELSEEQIASLKSLGVLKGKNLAEEKELATLNSKNVAQALEITGTKASTVAKGAKTTATFAETVAEEGLAAATWAALAPLLPYAIAIAAVVAAIGGFIFMIKAVISSYNKEEEALDKANESLKQQTELYNEAKNAYEELKSSIEDYKGAQNAIDEMVQGTQEWKDAIQEANEQVLDLMNTYPELASKIKSETIDGVTRLTVDEDALDELERAKRKESNSALARKLQSQQDVRAAENTLAAKNLNKELGIGQGEGAYWGMAGTGLLATAALAFINPAILVAAVPMLLGASALQAEAQQEATEKTEAALNKVADAYAKQGSSVFLKENLDNILGDEFKTLKDAIENNTSAIQDNIVALAANRTADDINSKTIARTFLENKDFYNNAKSSTKEAMVNTAAKIYDGLYSKYQKDYEDKNKLGGKTDAEIQEEYRELIGADKVRDKGGNVGEYLINGEWVTVSDAIARNALAQDKAGKEAANLNFSTIIPFFDNLEKSFQNEAIGQKISSALAAMGGGAEEISLETLSRKELENLRTLGFSLTEKEAKALGYKDAETARTAVEQSIKKTSKLWDNAASGIKNNVNRVNLESLFENSNIDLNAYKKFADQLGAVQEGVQGKIINSLFGASDQTVKNQILTALSGVDWQKDGFFAKDKFKELLAAEGFDFQNVENLNLVNFLANSLFDQLSDPDNWSLDTIDKYINKINDVSKSLKQMGDAIDKDKFENLHQDLKELFIELEDGTHVLGASKLAFEERKKAEIESIKTDLASRFSSEKRNTFIEQDRKNLQKNLEEAQEKRAEWEKKKGQIPSTIKKVDFGDGRTMDVKMTEWEKVKSLEGLVEIPLEIQNLLNYPSKADPTGMYLTLDQKAALQEFYDKQINNINEEFDYYASMVYTIQKQLNELDPEKITTEDANAISKLYKHAYSQEDLDQIEQLIGMFTGWTDEQKKQFEEDKTNAENYINYNNYMREVSLAQNEATIATESLNKALEKQNEILSALQKAAKSLALTEEQLAENLNEQIQAANKTIQENEKLLDFYSTNGVYKENLGKQLSAFTLGSEAEGSINKLFESVSSGNLSSTLTDLLTIVYDSVQDASQADSVYNSLKEIFVNEASRETEYAKTKGALIAAAAAAAELEVQKLRNISENFTKILGFEKEVNEFLRKIAEKNKDYAAIGQTYAADYMVAKEQYDVYATAVLNEQARIDELKSKKVLSLKESAELKELENRIIEDQKNLQDSILSGLESVQKVEEARLELGQKINEQYERQIKNAENFISVINHQIKLAKILNGEKAYGSFYENYNNILAQRQDQRELAISKYNEAWTTYNALGPNESDEIREKALNDIVETGKAALTSIEQTLDAAKEAFEYNIKAALNTVADIAATEAGINNYNWQYDFDTNHMSGLTRDLQLSNLGIKYQKAINQYAADESAQKRLLSVYQEVNKVLEEKETITKNDIALAEKRLALEQAKIDLENAQSDTSKMKLVRGANGEYTYQYIADENNILDKLAAYNNAQLNYQEQIRSSVKDVSGEVTKLIDLFNQLAITESDVEREEIWNRINQQISALKDTTEGLDLTVLPQSVQEFIMRWTTGGLASMEELRDECDGIARGYEQIKNDMQEVSKFLIGSEESKDGSLMYAMSLVQEDAEILQFTLEGMKSAFDDKKDGLLTKVAQFKTDLENAIDTVQLKASSLIATLNTKISGIVVQPSGTGKTSGKDDDLKKGKGSDIIPEAVPDTTTKLSNRQEYWYYKAKQVGVTTEAGQAYLMKAGYNGQALKDITKANITNTEIVNIYADLPGITDIKNVADAIKDLSDSTKN